MIKVKHGKVPDWYNQDCEHYDAYNENTGNSKTTNSVIEKILNQHDVKSILDMTCGTGSQVFWLNRRGFNTVGSDISSGMLNIAINKAQVQNLNIKFLLGDVRNLHVGKFDSVITIFNAIGHLSKYGFKQAIRNIYNNLNENGIYIFDIFNLDYYLQDNNITKLTIDWVRTEKNTKLRQIQYSIIDDNGVLVSYTIDYEQPPNDKIKMRKSIGTLQLYSATELQNLLVQNKFKVLGQYSIDGSAFNSQNTERILTVAKK